MSVETVEPAGPPPMTTTSAVPLIEEEGMEAFSFSVRSGRIYAAGGGPGRINAATTNNTFCDAALAPVAVWRLVRPPRHPEQFIEGPQVGAFHVAQLPRVAGADRA